MLLAAMLIEDMSNFRPVIFLCVNVFMLCVYVVKNFVQMDSAKIKIPEVVKFGYKNYECVVQNGEKCRAMCNSCDSYYWKSWDYVRIYKVSYNYATLTNVIFLLYTITIGCKVAYVILINKRNWIELLNVKLYSVYSVGYNL